MSGDRSMHEVGGIVGVGPGLIHSLRLDGMRLCAGCEDVFVLDGYYAECARLDAELEARRTEKSVCGVIFAGQPREDVGTVEFVPEPAGVTFAVLLVGGVASAVLAGCGAWFLGKAAIGLVLRLGW